MRKLVTILIACMAMSSIASRVYSKNPEADLMIVNARVWTVDPQHPEAEAIAILGDRIVAVGSKAELQAWKGADTKIVDAKGKLVLPGFNDSHVHFVSGGMQLNNVELKDAASPEEFTLRIAERAKNTSPGEWILGGNWDDQMWNPAVLPTRDWIDEQTKDIPVFVNRYDGHMALANSRALQMAGITSSTPDPPGGEIVRDAQGKPTGVLKDAAMSAVYQIIPDLSHDQRLRIIRQAMEYALSFGVTSVQDMACSYEDMAGYTELAERGELKIRIYAAPLETGWQDLAKIGLRRSFGSTFLRFGAIKGFADGSLGSTTAYFFEPYTDAPDTRGLLSDEMQPMESMQERLTGADAAGLQLCMHAIGDQAISIMLDMYHSIIEKNGDTNRRLRIEHAQHVAPKDFSRFEKMHVIASMQPYHAIDDGRWAEKRIGPERIKTTYAFRTFLDQHVRLAFGTDWNVAPLDPMQTIYAAVTRQTLDGRNPDGWVPEQKITVPETIEAYTMGSAFAEFQEHEKGSVTVGKLADLVILNQDIFGIPPKQIQNVHVETTIVGGKIAWTRSD